MRIKYEKSIIIFAAAAMLLLAGGCSKHRKTEVYNTTSAMEEEDMYMDEDEAASAYQEEMSHKEMAFTKNEWINAMKEKGYTEEITKFDEVESISFERDGCTIETGAPESEDEKCSHFNLYIDKSDYDSAIASDEVKSAYLDFARCLIELQGDTYIEDDVWKFITDSEELDGEAYYLSAGIEAYSQIYMNQILIVISPR